MPILLLSIDLSNIPIEARVELKFEFFLSQIKVDFILLSPSFTIKKFKNLWRITN